MQTKGLGWWLCLLLAGTASMTFTGCAGDKNKRSTGEYVDDKSLAVRVHSTLADNPDFKFGDVKVNVYRGTVQLSGFVNSPLQKSKAAEVAKTVPGVWPDFAWSPIRSTDAAPFMLVKPPR